VFVAGVEDVESTIHRPDDGSAPRGGERRCDGEGSETDATVDTMHTLPTTPALPRGRSAPARRDDEGGACVADDVLVVGVGTWSRRSVQQPDVDSASTMGRSAPRRRGDVAARSMFSSP
jgi:hypothetical protein